MRRKNAAERRARRVVTSCVVGDAALDRTQTWIVAVHVRAYVPRGAGEGEARRLTTRTRTLPAPAPPQLEMHTPGTAERCAGPDKDRRGPAICAIAIPGSQEADAIGHVDGASLEDARVRDCGRLRVRIV